MLLHVPRINTSRYEVSMSLSGKHTKACCACFRLRHGRFMADRTASLHLAARLVAAPSFQTAPEPVASSESATGTGAALNRHRQTRHTSISFVSLVTSICPSERSALPTRPPGSTW